MRGLALLALTFVLVAAALALARNALVAPLALRLARPWLLERGLELRVDAFGGSWTRSLTLEGVELSLQREGWRVRASARRLDLEGELLRLATSGAAALEEPGTLERVALHDLEATLTHADATGAARLALEELRVLEAERAALRGLHLASDLSFLPGVSLELADLGLALERARLPAEPLALLERVSASGLRARVDLAGERTPFPARSDAPRAPAAGRRAWRWPALALDDARVELALRGGGRLALEGLAVHSAAGEPGAAAPPALSVRADGLVQEGGGDRRRWSALGALVGWRDGRLEVASLSLGGEEVVREAWLELSELARGRAELALSISLYGGWAVLRGRLEDERVHASLAARELALGGLLALLEPRWSGGTSARVTLEGELDLPLAEPARTRAWLSLRETDLELAGLALEDVSAEAQIEDGRLRVEGLSAQVGSNRIARASLSTPLEDVSLSERLLASEAELELDCPDLAALLAALAPGSRRALAEGWSLRLVASLDEGALRLAGGELSGPAASARVQRGRVELESSGGRPTLGRVELALEAEARDLALVGDLLGVAGLAGSASGEIELAGRPASLGGAARLSARELALGELALGSAELALALEPGLLRLESVRVEGSTLQAELGGALALDPDAGASARELVLEARLSRPRALLSRWPDEEPVLVSARVDGPPSALSVSAEVASPLGEAAATGIVAVGPAGALEVRLDALRVDGAQGDLALRVPCALAFGPGSARVDGLALAGSAGALELDLALGPDAERVELALERFELPPWVGALLPGGLELGGASGRVRIEARAGAPSGMVALELARLRLGAAPPLSAEVRARLEAGRLELARVEVAQQGSPLLVVQGSAPFAPGTSEWLPDGELSLRAELSSPPLDTLAESGLPLLAELAGLAGRLEARVEVAGTWSAPRASAVVIGRELTWRPDDLWREGARVGPATLGVYASTDASGARLALDAHLDAPGQAQLDLAGELALPSDARELVARVADLELDLTAQATAEDLGFLQAVLPVVRRAEGRAEAELALSGTLSAPRVEGQARVEQGGLRTTTALPSLSALQLALRFEDRVLRLEPSTGELGGAGFRVEGSLGPLGSEPEVELRLTGERLLLYRLEGVRVRADADLLLDGPLAAPRLTGELALRDGLYVRNVDLLSLGGGRQAPGAGQRGFLLFSLRDPPLADARFDLRVRSATPFRIENNLVDAALRPELHVGGTGRVPLLDGRILVDESTVSLPSGGLRVESGSVVFDPADPFVPSVAIAARTRLRGYDVRLDLHGPYDRPEIEMVSVPPLPPRELLPLVLAGTPPESGGTQTVEAAAQELAVFLARDLAGKLFASESTEKGESIAERVEFESGRDVTKSGGTTARVTFRVADDLVAEDDSLYLAGERDVYDKINYGLRLLFRLR